MTHLLRLLNRKCKYEMYLANNVEDTEQTRFCPQMDSWMKGQMDEVKPVYPHLTLLSEGFKHQWNKQI